MVVKNPTALVILVDTDLINSYDINLVEGFNLSVKVAPKGGNCLVTRCSTILNVMCPMELKVIRDARSWGEDNKSNPYPTISAPPQTSSV